MKTSNRVRMVRAGMATVVLLAAGTLSGGRRPPGRRRTRAPAAKRTYDSSRRVPSYFGQIGLTPNEAVYKIRGKQQARIDELEKQIDEIQRGWPSVEGVLSDAQSRSCRPRRNAAAAGKKAEEPGKGMNKSGG